MQSTPAITIEQYTNEMVTAAAAFMNGDKRPFLDHCLKYSVALPRDEVVLMATVCKCVTGNTKFPMEMRSRAKRWLLEHKLMPFDDGDVPS